MFKPLAGAVTGLQGNDRNADRIANPQCAAFASFARSIATVRDKYFPGVALK
jgi:hypothetical protein